MDSLLKEQEINDLKRNLEIEIADKNLIFNELERLKEMYKELSAKVLSNESDLQRIQAI